MGGRKRRKVSAFAKELDAAQGHGMVGGSIDKLAAIKWIYFVEGGVKKGSTACMVYRYTRAR